MYELFLEVVELVEYFGYFGIFFMTAVESTFIPIPSEITLIPAGYLISSGDLSWFWVMVSSIAGTVCGSLANYYIAYYFGRHLLIKYGRYFFLNDKKLANIEGFFERHGAISTFSGRLLPGIKHFISFPAGLGKMSLKTFCIYTALGGAIWTAVLLVLGYMIGSNAEMIKQYIKQINFILFVLIVCIATFYIWKNKIKIKL